jgi:hypothetical protein
MSTIISRSIDAATIAPAFIKRPFVVGDEAQSLVHNVIGRSVPDLTLRPGLLGAGSLEMYFYSAAEAENARVFHRAASTFLVTSDDAAFLPGEYVPQGRVNQAQQSDDLRHWILTVPFQDIAGTPPTTPPPGDRMLIQDEYGYVRWAEVTP